MSRLPSRLIAIVMGFSLTGQMISANEYIDECVYQADDVLCGGGFSPESYHQRIRDTAYQRMAAYTEQRFAAAYEAAAEQRTLEKRQAAHRAQREKDARRKEDIIAKRKAQNAKNVGTKSVASTTSTKVIN